MSESDSAAVARAKEGDGEAYRVLVERHSRSLFRLAFRMTGNEQDAEDVVQETFLRAYKQLNRYESRASFSTWIYRIAANASLDLLRSRRRRQEMVAQEREEGETAMDVIDQVAASDPQPDRLVFSGQVQHRVAEAMNELSQQERTAFVLRHFEGQSIEEIGTTLGLNTNAAKHSIFRAVQKLRRALEPVVGSAS